MNLEGYGNALFTIKNDKNKKNAYTHFNFINLTKENESIQQIPDFTKERTITYICGASGSGKSYYTKKYADEYRRIYPKNEIYLISSITDDSSIDKLKGLKRIDIKNPDFIKDELTADDFKNSLVIFDDTDCITNKLIKNKVNSLLHNLLEVGRHSNVSLVLTSHLAYNGNETKKILNECHSITFFPLSLGGRSLKYLLECYLGLDKDQIKKLKNIKSRWITILKTYPQVVLGEKDAFLLKDL